MLLSLSSWAQRTYGESMPRINTLRKWVRENKISPPPEKHGRQYFVRPDAVYNPGSPLVERLRREETETHAAA